MKKISLLIVCFAIIILNYSISQAQTNNWIRVSSDGEFSIEVPAKFNLFYDKNGVFTSKDQNNFQLQKTGSRSSKGQKRIVVSARRRNASFDLGFIMDELRIGLGGSLD